MLKKLSIIALVLIGATGAYALVANLFPNTVSFPRIPMQAGTIGAMFSKILGTTDIEGSYGTVANTLMLSGADASGYVHTKNCTNIGEVWLGIDASGIPQCGLKGTMLAFAILTEGDANVQVNGSIVASFPMPLHIGDIVSTPSGGSASIGFPSDDSVVRLDSDTSIEIQSGTLDGRTVAQVNLDNGLLWGRVLTSTGINFGAGGYIAGVRGTSIAMSNNGTDVSVTIPHSTHLTNAVTVTNSGAPIGMNVFTGGVGTRLDHLHIVGSYIPHSVISYDANILYDPMSTPLANWITLNTKKDILYLDYITHSGATTGRKLTASDELTATLPHKGEADCTHLLSGIGIIQSPTVSTGWVMPLSQIKLSIDPDTTITTDVQHTTCAQDITPDSIKCAVQGLFWWSDLRECAPGALAYADYTRGSSALHFSGSSLALKNAFGVHNVLLTKTNKKMFDNGKFKDGSLPSPLDITDTTGPYSSLITQLRDKNNLEKEELIKWIYVVNPSGGSPTGNAYSSWTEWKYPFVIHYGTGSQEHPTDGIAITSSGQFISYDVTALSGAIGTLSGKTVTIELSTDIPATGKHYLLDFGNTKAWRDAGVYYLSTPSGGATGSALPITKGGYTLNVIGGDTKKLSLQIGTTAPTQMIIGNIGIPSIPASHLTAPIGTTIQRITISN